MRPSLCPPYHECGLAVQQCPICPRPPTSLSCTTAPMRTCTGSTTQRRTGDLMNIFIANGKKVQCGTQVADACCTAGLAGLTLSPCTHPRTALWGGFLAGAEEAPLKTATVGGDCSLYITIDGCVTRALKDVYPQEPERYELWRNVRQMATPDTVASQRAHRPLATRPVARTSQRAFGVPLVY